MNRADFIKELVARLLEIHRLTGRTAVAFLAGPPAAGKSTLAKEAETASGGAVRALQMDGFHRTNEYLKTHFRGRGAKRMPLARIKGAPETFDFEALKAAIAGIAGGETRFFPVYSRELHEPVPDAVPLDSGAVIIEGNYLLLDSPPWRELAAYADITCRVVARCSTLESRLIRRKLNAGWNYHEARRFALESDLKNARLVLKHSLPADYTLFEDAEGHFTAQKNI